MNPTAVIGNQNAGPSEVIGQIRSVETPVAITNSASAISRAAVAGVRAHYIPLTAESLAAANPDCIIALTAGPQTVGGQDNLLRLPGEGQITAAEQGGILPFEDQYFVGGSPRMGDVLRELLAAFHPELPRKGKPCDSRGAACRGVPAQGTPASPASTPPGGRCSAP